VRASGATGTIASTHLRGRRATFASSLSLNQVDHLKMDDADVGGWTAERHVTALYQAHALSLARLALVMLGDRSAAEDVVQDAFLGLYRRWDRLADPAVAPSYLRTSVLNGCRTALRARPRHGVLSDGTDAHEAALAGSSPSSSLSLSLESAEATVVHGEEHRAVLAAIRRLPARQREALVLRYYLDLTEEQTAEAMQVSRGTVKSATSRAIAAVGRMLGAPDSRTRSGEDS
jgi:RNA polymerase sigma factor (sigma-70 family)